ncbi:hypothetical protein C8Q75DRAFT_82617 [Abortiporus biennis]|nr:hypothetical protein C8Q75DRAFT_82617 [Abortiporus biennis]
MSNHTVEVLKHALQSFENPSRGPKPEDCFLAQYWEMAGAHACLINSLLSIYEQAPSVSKDKFNDFVGYALQWVACLQHHHDWEENLYYPLFQHKFDTTAIVAEHQTFEVGLHALDEYLTSCLPPNTKYGYGKVTAATQEQHIFEPSNFRALIDAFAVPLSTHLCQEITYLEPEKVKESGLTEDELKHIAEVSDKHMLSMSPTTFLTFVVTASPKTSEFPPAPGFVKSFLVPYVFSWANRRLWQFAPN